jgi:hypothetical protein
MQQLILDMKAKSQDRKWMFFALFVLAGCAAMVPFVMQAVRDYRIMRVYEETECTILSYRQVPSTTVFRWANGRTTERTTSYPEFTFAYRANGRDQVAAGFDNLEGKLAESADYEHLRVNEKARCWYDPARPDRAVLLRRVPWLFYLGALIPGLFIASGGYFMKRALSRKHDYGRVSAQAGRVLRFRLAPVLSHQRLTGCLFAVVVVIGLAIAGVASVPWGSSTTDLFSPMFYLFAGLVVVEGFIIKHFVRAVRAVQVPEPEVEIDAEPLRPSQRVAVRVTQHGPLRALSYRVLLVCEEVASGTRTPVKQSLVDAGEVVIEDDRAATARSFDLEVLVPAKAKPSARTLQSMRTWNIRILRKLDESTTLETDYPFRVLKRSEAEPDAPVEVGDDEEESLQ